jgi:hypothetical protein
MHILAVAPAVLRRKLDGDFGKTIHQTTQRQSASVYKYQRRRILDPGRRGNDNASNKVASEQRTPVDFEANDNGHDGGKEDSEQTEQTVRLFPGIATSPSS